MKIKNSIIERYLREEDTKQTIADAAEEFGSSYANEITSTAKKMEGPTDVINTDGNSREALGKVGEMLDRAYNTAKRMNRKGKIGNFNVLLVGRGGTGKTAKVEAWADDKGVNLVQKDAKTMDPTDLGGIVGRHYDDEGKPSNYVTKLANKEFGALDKPNSVLFLDELNRAPQDVIGSLLELINNHTVVDQEAEGGKRRLKGFLFTVAAINPPKVGNKVDKLDNPMRSRFGTVYIENNKKEQLAFFNSYFKITTENMTPEDKKEDMGRLSIAKTLLDSPDFLFDGDEEEDRAEREQIPVLNSRSLTNLLDACDGTSQDFLDLWSIFCNPYKKPVVEDIMANYVDVDDTANDVFDRLGSDGNPFAQKKVTSWDKLDPYMN